MTCPAEATAIQAANTLRAMKALGHEDLRDAETAQWRTEDFPLVRQMNKDSKGPTAEWAEKALFRQLRGLASAASLQRAMSVKGAIFQAYVGANIASCISGNISGNATSAREIAAMEAAEHQTSLLFSSAIAALEAVYGIDPDLEILRQWFRNPETDDGRLILAVVQKAAA